ncbi:predicted protein [Histoplasma capsulatum G186AR]|uniref:Uncharacterized protein n=1 Tax=Ajellomyces capsulatus (strain G186AR / H82 / ATCC MYA-2454 / RMSCC 2432) TaxID=447093 RepID=C0NE51_AJECG|nr:uncharacterized protein HCBG_02144 [Histoplasma capsulatum G186AR]EEH10499.1 predicted protein [Histoplasma capsulatum G186AR]
MSLNIRAWKAVMVLHSIPRQVRFQNQRGERRAIRGPGIRRVDVNLFIHLLSKARSPSGDHQSWVTKWLDDAACRTFLPLCCGSIVFVTRHKFDRTSMLCLIKPNS